jgi:Domain of unknown function (DUF4328)
VSRTFDELRSASARSATVAVDSLNMMPLYFSTRRTARVLGILFVLQAALGWVAVGYDLGELRVLHNGQSLAPAAVLAHDAAGERIAAAQLAGAGLLAAVFVPWLHQARANARALGARRMRFSREWTWLGFATPVLNAYRPYQVVCEVWLTSDPASLDPLGWQRLTAPRLVLAWWLGFAGWVVLASSAEFLLRVAPGVAHAQIAHALALAGDAGAAVSASLGYFVVAQISAAQDAKWARIGRSERVTDLGAPLGSAVGAGV